MLALIPVMSVAPLCCGGGRYNRVTGESSWEPPAGFDSSLYSAPSFDSEPEYDMTQWDLAV
jgi:hypothetical protein